MTKICSKCKLEKDAEEFNWKNKRQGTRSCYCRKCWKAYAKKHYRKHKQYYIDKAEKRLLENKLKAVCYLEQRSCTDCHEQDVRVLDFDHKRDKNGNISNMIANGCAWKTILKEIEKCEIRCANCHRKKTSAELGWRSKNDILELLKKYE